MRFAVLLALFGAWQGCDFKPAPNAPVVPNLVATRQVVHSRITSIPANDPAVLKLKRYAKAHNLLWCISVPTEYHDMYCGTLAEKGPSLGNDGACDFHLADAVDKTIENWNDSKKVLSIGDFK
jgi:hypothetical protein